MRFPGAAELPESRLLRESVEKQLRKTGNTEFTFDQLEIELEECFSQEHSKGA